MKRAVNPRRSIALGLKTCQKDQMKRPSGLHYGDQLDADSLAGDEEPEFKIGIKYIYYRTLCLNSFRIGQVFCFDLQGIPGSRALFGKTTHPLRRVFWILLTLVFFFLAAVQVSAILTLN